MPKLTNREIERHYFDKFSRVYPLPPGTIVHKDKPDILLLGEKKIGVEITQFFKEIGSHQGSEQQQIMLREASIRQAQVEFKRINSSPIHLSFSFDVSVPIKNKSDFAKRVTDFALTIASSEDRHRKFLYGADDGRISPHLYTERLPELSMVYVADVSGSTWGIAQAYQVLPSSKKRLKEIIADKESKSIEYESCDEYWLLVVVDMWNPAQDQGVQSKWYEGVSSDVFTKILVYKTGEEHVVELPEIQQ